MKFFNTNALHNLLNIASGVFAALALFDWSQLVDKTLALKVVAGCMLAKLVINAVRDGVKGMIEPQPPVGS